MVGEPPQPASSVASSARADLMSTNFASKAQIVNFLYGSPGPCLKLGLSATTTGAREYPTLVAARCVLSTTAILPPERVSYLICPVSRALIMSSRSFSTESRYCLGSSPVSSHRSIVATRSASGTLKSMTAAAMAASSQDDSAVAVSSFHGVSRVGRGFGPV